MNVAFLILGYKYPRQIGLLLEHIKHPNHYYFIHIDKGVNIIPFKEACEGISDRLFWVERESSFWGSYQCVKALLNGIRMAFENDNFHIDYFIHLSGQDFPLKSPDLINKFLEQSAPKNFINIIPLPIQEWKDGGWDRIKNLKIIWNGKRFVIHSQTQNFFLKTLLFVFRRLINIVDQNKSFFGGEFYFMLHRSGVELLLKNIENFPVFFKRLQWVSLPEEIIIQTMIMCGDYDSIQLKDDIYRFIDWSKNGKSPLEFSEEKLFELLDSKFLFGRKFTITDPNFKIGFDD